MANYDIAAIGAAELALIGAGANLKRAWRGARGQWLEGDSVRCPECGRRARLEHWYGAEDCSMLATVCCSAVVVAEAEAGGALLYPYGVRLWNVNTKRKVTQ